MQVGDPKKTAILAVVAVLALGFCYRQLTAGNSEPKVLRGGGDTNVQATPQPTATVAMLQLDPLRVDAFSHPKLAPKSPGAPATIPSGPTTPPQIHGPIGGSDSGGTVLPGPYSNDPIDKGPNPDWTHPVVPGPKPEDVQVVKLTRVTLKAIVRVTQSLAYISVDGQEARGYRPGDLIKDGIELAFVNDDSVIIKSSKTTVTLKVGQQGDV